jgi:hypothetical protein
VEKLGLTQQQGFVADQETVIEAVWRPREAFSGYQGRLIAQTILDEDHTLRVVCEENGEITVVTLYPGRRRRYES